MLQFCPCSLALCLVSNASNLWLCNDLVEESISRSLESCNAWFWGCGEEGWDQCCKGRQGWICFQMDQLPELTQHVVQSLVLLEGYLQGTTGRTALSSELSLS